LILIEFFLVAAAIKVQVQSHVKELNDNLQEEKDTRHEIIDNYYGHIQP